MKTFYLCIGLVLASIYSMDTNQLEAAKEIQTLFRQFKAQEEQLKQEYHEAVVAYQKTRSPVTEHRFIEARENLESPKSAMRRLMKSPHSEFFDPLNMNQLTLELIVKNISKNS